MERTSVIHQCFLEERRRIPRGQSREELYSSLFSRTKNTPLQIMDGGHGRRIFVKDEACHPFSHSHYGRCWPLLLRGLEAKGNLRSDTEILEVTSGNAGISGANIGGILGFNHWKIVVPPMDAARMELLKECADVIPSRYPEQNLAGAVRTFREMIGTVADGAFHLTPETKRRLQSGELVLPNHSQHPITVEAFSAIGREIADQLPSDARLGGFVGAVGNGSTILGIYNGLRERLGDALPPFFGFNGPMQLYGAGGTDGVSFPFIEQLRKQRIIRDDTVYHLRGDEWSRSFKEDNEGQRWDKTFGRTSTFAIKRARQLIDQSRGRIGDLLTVRYDTAVGYGDTCVTDPEAVFENGTWNQGT